MRLLLDANLSWRLTSKLKNIFSDCCHVDYCELISPASDTEIWDYAKSFNFIIVTNDIDFLNFLNLKGFPPKIILLKIGNQGNSYIYDLLIKHLSDIENLSLSDEFGVLELYEPNIPLT